MRSSFHGLRRGQREGVGELQWKVIGVVALTCKQCSLFSLSLIGVTLARRRGGGGGQGKLKARVVGAWSERERELVLGGRWCLIGAVDV